MPFLLGEQVEELLVAARYHGACRECGQQTAMDYCRSCDEFYWIHQPGCLMHTSKHGGHRLTIVPFTEEK